MVALTVDLGGMAQGLQGTLGKAERVAHRRPWCGSGKHRHWVRPWMKIISTATLRIASLPLAVTVGMPVAGEFELWRQHVAAGAALAAILIAGIAGAVRILLWLSARQSEAIARVFKSERALQEQEALQQSLIDAIPLPLSMRNEKGIFIRCNRAFLDLTLRRRDEVLGRTSAELFGRETAGLFDQGIAEALARATPIRFEMSLTDAIGANARRDHLPVRPSPCRRRGRHHRQRHRGRNGSQAGRIGAEGKRGALPSCRPGKQRRDLGLGSPDRPDLVLGALEGDARLPGRRTGQYPGDVGGRDLRGRPHRRPEAGGGLQPGTGAELPGDPAVPP